MDAGRHPNIELITLAEVTELTGSPGSFKATVMCQPRYVIEERCTGCGDCIRVCPQTSPNAWDLGLATRKAIYRPYPQAVPSAYVIDIDTCLNSPTHFVCERCRRVCKREAIEHDMVPTTRELNVGAVIVATGFDEFHPHVMGSYGYGVWTNIVTSLEFERLLNASGPTQGHVIRPSDHKTPHTIVFIQCVGARGEGNRPNCSRYCCMNAVKDALLVKQHEPDVASCTILYTDIRAFGKGFDSFVEQAENADHVRFIRGRPSKLMAMENDDVEIFVEDTETLTPLRLQADMVVLSCAGIPRPETETLADVLGVDVNEIGFFAAGGSMAPVETSRTGVFLCGSAGGPQIIPDCVAQASAAAARASVYVKDHKLPDPEPLIPKPIDPHSEPRIGVFICHCGANIGRVIKISDLVDETRSLPDVVYAGEELFACADTGQRSIQEKIEEHRLNRVVVAACTPRTHEHVFRNACLGAGLNPYLLEMTNIRDQCSWVHSKTRDKARGKAIDLIRMSVARARHLEPLDLTEVSIEKHVLIIGGGIAGIRAALDLDDLNMAVTLVESGPEPGGRSITLHGIFPAPVKPEHSMESILKSLEKSRVEVILNTRVKEITGFVGNFNIELENTDTGDSLPPFKSGAIIVAIGSDLTTPGKQWRYGEAANVLTSMDLERLLENGDPDGLLKKSGQAVFIQCVGSRDKNDGYSGCSRYCCPTSVKQADALTEYGMDATVLYRDMRMVGQGAEEYYRDVRHKGVLFLRYDLKHPPQLKGKKKIESVSYFDTLMGKTITVPANLVVLAVGMVNESASAETLRTLLKIPRGSDGFFLERHPELGPVETCIDGVYVCGTIQGPKDIADTLVQASAAAGKAVELLSRETLYLEPVICEVDPNRCRACHRCVELCEYHAPGMVTQPDGRPVAEINRALCKGCGTCAVWCPTGAISASHFTDDQIGEMITALFEDYHA